MSGSQEDHRSIGEQYCQTVLMRSLFFYGNKIVKLIKIKAKQATIFLN